MQDWMLPTFAALLLAVAVKLLSGVASGMKRKMDAFHEGDPIISALAWIDRVTSLHRR